MTTPTPRVALAPSKVKLSLTVACSPQNALGAIFDYLPKPSATAVASTAPQTLSKKIILGFDSHEQQPYYNFGGAVPSSIRKSISKEP